MNEAANVKTAVLLEHHGSEEMWTATVPVVAGCIAEGKSPDEATQNVRSVLAKFLAEDQKLYEVVAQPVQFLLTEIEVSPPATSIIQ